MSLGGKKVPGGKRKDEESGGAAEAMVGVGGPGWILTMGVAKAVKYLPLPNLSFLQPLARNTTGPPHLHSSGRSNSASLIDYIEGCLHLHNDPPLHPARKGCYSRKMAIFLQHGRTSWYISVIASTLDLRKDLLSKYFQRAQQLMFTVCVPKFTDRAGHMMSQVPFQYMVGL